jgi:hypothetical protein
MNAASSAVREYLRDEFDGLLANKSFAEAIPMRLRGDAAN